MFFIRSWPIRKSYFRSTMEQFILRFQSVLYNQFAFEFCKTRTTLPLWSKTENVIKATWNNMFSQYVDGTTYCISIATNLTFSETLDFICQSSNAACLFLLRTLQYCHLYFKLQLLIKRKTFWLFLIKALKYVHFFIIFDGIEERPFPAINCGQLGSSSSLLSVGQLLRCICFISVFLR